MKNFAFGFGLALVTLAAPSLVRADMLHWGIYDDPDVIVWGDGSKKPLSELDAWGAQVVVFKASDTGVDLGKREVQAYLDLWIFDEDSRTYVTTKSEEAPRGDLAAIQAKTDPDHGQSFDNWTDLGIYGSEENRNDYMFAVAIFDNTGNGIALTEAVAYGAISQYVSESPLFSHIPDEWHAGGFIIPEPSGGVLIALGLMMLGLKRKQEVA